MADPYCACDTVLVLVAALLDAPALRHVLANRDHIPHPPPTSTHMPEPSTTAHVPVQHATHVHASIGVHFRWTMLRLACLAALVLAAVSVPHTPRPDAVFARALLVQTTWLAVVPAAGAPATVGCMAAAAVLSFGSVLTWLGAGAVALRCAHVLGWTGRDTCLFLAALGVTAAAQLALGSFVLLG